MSKKRNPPTPRAVTTALDTIGREVEHMEHGPERDEAVNALRDLWLVVLKVKVGQVC